MQTEPFVGDFMVKAFIVELILICVSISINVGFSSESFSINKSFQHNLSMAEGGGWSSGGGTIINLHGRGSNYTLVDLFLHDQNYEDNFNGEDKLQGRNAEIKLLDIETLKSFQILQSRLDVWRKHFPDLVYLIQQTLEFTHFYYIRGTTSHGNYELPFDLKLNYSKAKTKRVATYAYLSDKLSYGVLIYSKEWNQTGINSKAGILLHEALRQIQIAYNDRMNDKTLEEFTAMIIMDDPADGIIQNLKFGDFLSDVVQYPDDKLRQQLVQLCEKFEDKYEYLDECHTQTDMVSNDISNVAARVTKLLVKYLPIDSNYMFTRNEFVMLYLQSMKVSLRKTLPGWYDLERGFYQK